MNYSESKIQLKLQYPKKFTKHKIIFSDQF